MIPTDPAVYVPEPCLNCGTDVLTRSPVTVHHRRGGRRVVGWSCCDACAEAVESRRDAKGVLNPVKKKATR